MTYFIISKSNPTTVDKNKLYKFYKNLLRIHLQDFSTYVKALRSKLLVLFHL